MSAQKIARTAVALLLSTHFVAAQPAEPTRNMAAFGAQMNLAPRPPRLIRTSLDAASGEPLSNARLARLIRTSLDAEHAAAHLAMFPPRKLRSVLEETGAAHRELPSAYWQAPSAAPSVVHTPALDPSWLEENAAPSLPSRRLIRTDLSSAPVAPVRPLPGRRLRLTLD